MNQPSFDFSAPLTHREDPATSFKAEEGIRKSGRLQAQCELVLKAIKEHPNSTAGELAARSGIDYQIIQRRVSMLQRNGLISRNKRRICSEKGTTQSVLEITG